jgi:hypothetical protein
MPRVKSSRKQSSAATEHGRPIIAHQADDVLMNQQFIRDDQKPVPQRPTEYTKEIGKTICGRLVEDESLRSICSEPGMPDLATVASWISNNKEFREIYAFARECQAHCIADETLELVDENSTQWVEKVRANGRVVWGPDRNSRPRCQLRLEVRNWVFDELLARARKLSARRLFELPIGPESKILEGLSLDFSHIMKGSRYV